MRFMRNSKFVLIVFFFSAIGLSRAAENILKSTLISQETGWSVWIEKGVKAAGGACEFVDGKALIKSPAQEKMYPYNLQFMRPLTLEIDKTYKLRCTIQSDKVGAIEIAYCMNTAPYSIYAKCALTVSEGEKEYECDLGVHRDRDGKFVQPRALRFFVGGLKDASIIVSMISLEVIK